MVKTSMHISLPREKLQNLLPLNPCSLNSTVALEEEWRKGHESGRHVRYQERDFSYTWKGSQMQGRVLKVQRAAFDSQLEHMNLIIKKQPNHGYLEGGET